MAGDRAVENRKTATNGTPFLAELGMLNKLKNSSSSLLLR